MSLIYIKKRPHYRCDVWNKDSFNVVDGVRFYKRHFAFALSKSIFILMKKKDTCCHRYMQFNRRAACVSLYKVLKNGRLSAMAEDFL